MSALSHLDLTHREKQTLTELSQATRYPIVRLELHRDGEPDLVSIALDNVRIVEEDDTVELIKERGEALRHLAELGLVRLDYNIKVWGTADYNVYYRSELYEMFCHLVMEGASQPDFLFNLAVMRKGRASLTKAGVAALALC